MPSKKKSSTKKSPRKTYRKTSKKTSPKSPRKPSKKTSPKSPRKSSKKTTSKPRKSPRYNRKTGKKPVDNFEPIPEPSSKPTTEEFFFSVRNPSANFFNFELTRNSTLVAKASFLNEISSRLLYDIVIFMIKDKEMIFKKFIFEILIYIYENLNIIGFFVKFNQNNFLSEFMNLFEAKSIICEKTDEYTVIKYSLAGTPSCKSENDKSSSETPEEKCKILLKEKDIQGEGNEIKKAWRKWLLINHPDKCDQNDKECVSSKTNQVSEVNNCMEVLKYK
jgi:hypothetical protein